MPTGALFFGKLLAKYVLSRAFSFSFDVLIPSSIDLCFDSGSLARYERTTGKYVERGVKYVHMEVGRAARNVYLQAVSLGLGTVVVGAFDDDEVERLFYS